MIHIIFILIQPFSDPSCFIDEGIVILEETAPIRIEMFYHRIKVITQNNFVLICSDPSCQGDKWTQTMPAKCPPQITEPLDPLTVGVKHSDLYQFFL